MKPTARCWQIVGLALIVAATPLQRLRGSFPTEDLFHSDIAFLPALFRDVAGGGSLLAWGLPEAPYFIPDWPLWFVAWLITPSYSSGLAVFALLQIGTLAVVWLGVARYLSTDPLTATALGVGALVTAGLAGQIPADYASVSFAHFGTFILTLGGLGLLYRYHFGSPARHPHQEPHQDPHPPAHPPPDRRRLLVAGLLVLACLGTTSDRLFIVWWVVPVVAIEVSAIVAGRAQGWSPRLRKITATALPVGSWPVVGVLSIGSVAGLLLHGVVVRSSGDYRVGWAIALTIGDRWRLIADDVVRLELTALWPYPLVVVAVAVVGAAACWHRRAHTPTVTFAVWFVVAAAATLAAEALRAEPGWRFHQFLYHVPVLAVGAWLPAALRRLRLPPAGVVGGLSVAVFAWGATPVGDLSLARTPVEVECLDAVIGRSGSRVGIGNYAAARLAVVHSRFELDVGARNSWMAPEEDVHSRAWARTSADFAILYPTIFGTMPETTIRALGVGAPTETRCGRWRILDFGPGGIDLDRLNRPDGAAETSGCWYAHPTGRPAAHLATPLAAPGPAPGGACTLRVTPADVDPGNGAYVGFGAHHHVPPGAYQLTARLAEGTAAAGAFEVAVWDANSGELRAVHSAPLTDPRLHLRVDETGPEVSFEPRILYRGGEPLILEAMRIERTG